MRILIAYDGSGNSRNSLNELRRSGLPQNAEVSVVSVSEIWLSPKTVPVSDLTTSDNDISEYFQKHSEQIFRNLAEAKAILFEAAETLHRFAPDWTIKTEVVSGSATEQILLKVAACKPDLIVIGAQGLSWDKTERLGSVSNKILAEAKCSVRVARTKIESDPKMLKIAICFDGSPDSVQAVKEVASRNWQQKIEILLIVVADLLNALIPGRAFRVIPGLPEGKMIGEKKWIDSFAKDAIRILDNAGHFSELRIFSGNPRIVLVNEIRNWGADTIFIGASSGNLHNSTLGSVAWAVAARSHCTAEVIRRR